MPEFATSGQRIDKRNVAGSGGVPNQPAPYRHPRPELLGVESMRFIGKVNNAANGTPLTKNITADNAPAQKVIR